MTRQSLVLSIGIGVFLLCHARATQPSLNFSDKSVAQLLELLENKDGTVRHCAAIAIGDRYRDPSQFVVNGLIQKPNSPARQLPLPPQVVPKLAEHLKSDPDLNVRICAVHALRDLHFETNTTAVLLIGLDDKDSLVRIRTCSALITTSRARSLPLHERVIPTLIQCLDPKGEVERIWQAAYAAEPLGTNGVALVPALRELKKHESGKVRDYADRALSKIAPSTKK